MTFKIRSRRRFSVLFPLAVYAGLMALLLAPASRAQECIIQLDPAQTRIEFSLDATMHTVRGKFALKNGVIRFDPSTGKIGGAIVVDATSGESGDDSRDGRMHREILESAKFPEIVFTPTQISDVANASGSSKGQVSGRFRLHGQEHDVTLPIDVKWDGKNLWIAMHMNIPYVQWGLKNPSNFFLRVGDVVAIEIHAAGSVQSGGKP